MNPCPLRDLFYMYIVLIFMFVFWENTEGRGHITLMIFNKVLVYKYIVIFYKYIIYHN